MRNLLGMERMQEMEAKPTQQQTYDFSAMFPSLHLDELKKEIKTLEDDIFTTSKVVLSDTLKSMKRVLRRLSFADK